MLEHVIVTALGLEKDEATLAYSVQKIKGEELNRVKEVNMIAALAGKAAGVQINKNSSGMGGYYAKAGDDKGRAVPLYRNGNRACKVRKRGRGKAFGDRRNGNWQYDDVQRGCFGSAWLGSAACDGTRCRLV